MESSTEGAVGGYEISDSNSVGASSTDGGSTVGPDRLEIELKAAKQQVSSTIQSIPLSSNQRIVL